MGQCQWWWPKPSRYNWAFGLYKHDKATWQVPNTPNTNNSLTHITRHTFDLSRQWPRSQRQPSSPPLRRSNVTTSAVLTVSATSSPPPRRQHQPLPRRDFLSLSLSSSAAAVLFSPEPAAAADEEYVKDTEEVISKVRTTLTMEKSDPNVAAAVAELREASNSWVAKYRKEKALIGKASFRDIYSALNAVSGHYISFGPTAPVPAKRKTRILEEMDTAEKALLRGR
ncbi:PREDICTED: photosystem II repair protein PSB27-H1, chloroplastic-like [Tarenaya hassleriana]|uniref:photosystem II repair protein PSB27-H1, chloroplastic-like n=1 Tax=Tarenaya hassleriana TaxID=28532 RepID=UPI00053C2950|nr:PREDICTED: photosystem II repair protein PSB27-H1, chloroplastic-like [Tarenaya hassleriana]